MRLREWLNASTFSVKSFAETLGVERAMVYRYFTGAIPRARTIRRIELLTNGAVTAQDFYETAVQGGIMPSGAGSGTAIPGAAPPQVLGAVQSPDKT